MVKRARALVAEETLAANLTNLRPDVVWWSEQQKVLWILQLTISFETMMENAHQTKTPKYRDLVEEVRLGGCRAECIAFEVGSRLLIESELMQLRDTLSAPGKTLIELALSLSRSAILGLFKIIMVLQESSQ